MRDNKFEELLSVLEEFDIDPDKLIPRKLGTILWVEKDDFVYSDGKVGRDFAQGTTVRDESYVIVMPEKGIKEISVTEDCQPEVLREALQRALK